MIDALQSHVEAPNTIAISGEWEGQACINYVDLETGLDVVTHPDGRLWPAVRLSDDRVQRYIATDEVVP
jgi:hypothetical protein